MRQSAATASSAAAGVVLFVVGPAGVDRFQTVAEVVQRDQVAVAVERFGGVSADECGEKSWFVGVGCAGVTDRAKRHGAE